MRERGLQVRPLRRFVRTTNGEHDSPVFLNLARELVATGADQLWVADITYIATARGSLYLAVVVLDDWSRRVVGYALGRQLDTRGGLGSKISNAFRSALCDCEGRRRKVVSSATETELENALRPGPIQQLRPVQPRGFAPKQGAIKNTSAWGQN
jgi:transposase InsO family protein